MKTVTELLLEADPLRHEATWSHESRQRTRQAVLNAVRPNASRRHFVFSFAVLCALTFVMAGAFGLMRSKPAVAATILFEVRLAEDRFAPGLEEAAVAGSDRRVYLYPETIVTNGDIVDARVIEGSAGAFGVAVTFSEDGAIKMLRATRAHVGRPLAIVLDGEVAIAPTLRSTIGGSAVLDGDYTRAEAERIANGIMER